VFTTSTSWAQSVSSAQVSGVVRDSSGGALPGADVTITKIDTGAARSAVSGADGTYIFPNLPVGPYQLKVELQGFNTYQRDGIVLQSVPTRRLTMAVGTVSETVTVSRIARWSKPLDRHWPVVDNQRRRAAPQRRQATELIFLAGLATSAPAGDLNTNKNFPTVTIRRRWPGQRHDLHADGGTHNDPFNNLNLPTPFPDAMQEFKVEPARCPRVGHHAASAVNIITKSGTNSFKGSAFEFNRDYHFNAKNHFAATRDSLRRNTFGGVRRPDEQGVLLRRLPGADREDQPADDHQLHPDPRHVERRFHDRIAGLQWRRQRT
jgi:hypothetical protein